MDSVNSLANQPVTILKGVGPRSAERLANMGIHTIQDLLFHLPLRYQDRTRISAIGSSRHGDHVVIDAHVEYAQIKFGRRRSLLVQVSDGTGSLLLRFFHFSNAQKNSFSRGTRISCFGEVRRGPASLEMIHPDCIIQRLTGEGNRNIMTAPAWAFNKLEVINKIKQILRERNSYQGRLYDR